MFNENGTITSKPKYESIWEPDLNELDENVTLYVPNIPLLVRVEFIHRTRTPQIGKYEKRKSDFTLPNIDSNFNNIRCQNGTRASVYFSLKVPFSKCFKRSFENDTIEKKLVLSPPA